MAPNPDQKKSLTPGHNTEKGCIPEKGTVTEVGRTPQRGTSEGDWHDKARKGDE